MGKPRQVKKKQKAVKKPYVQKTKPEVKPVVNKPEVKKEERKK